MIPIIPKQTVDDDNRPKGLKLARTNYFNYQKKDPTMNQSPVEDRQSTRSSISPTLPVRSPFRIRDSQTSTRRSTQQEEPNIYSSLSSSTSSVATLEDDLSQELENMWKIRSPIRPIKSDVHQQDLFLQLLISQAVVDAHEYKVLSFEEIEALKEHREKLKAKVRNLASKLELDKKIQETSHSLSHLASNRQSVILSRDEAMEADRKVEELTKQLKELKTDEIQTQYKILEHTAGVLCHGLQQLEKKRSSIPFSEIRSDMQQITETLISIIKKHNVQYNSVDIPNLLYSLEKHIAQKSYGSEKSDEAEIAQLRSLVTEVETQLINIQQQAQIFKRREEELKKETEQYREQVLTLRLEIERKDKNFIQQTHTPKNERQFEQQIEEQEQEYQAQLKEQTALLNKTIQEYEKVKLGHDALVTTCEDLDRLVIDKSRALGTRDSHIAQLESEIYSKDEHIWIEKSTEKEGDFENISKEVDRMTSVATDFEYDRGNYERRIAMLKKEAQELQEQLENEKCKNIDLGKVKYTQNTESLRNEYRKIISDIQLEHRKALEKEAEEKKRLEKQLKELKHEREIARYERINKGVQTPLFIS